MAAFAGGAQHCVDSGSFTKDEAATALEVWRKIHHVLNGVDYSSLVFFHDYNVDSIGESELLILEIPRHQRPRHELCGISKHGWANCIALEDRNIVKKHNFELGRRVLAVRESLVLHRVELQDSVRYSSGLHCRQLVPKAVLKAPNALIW